MRRLPPSVCEALDHDCVGRAHRAATLLRNHKFGTEEDFRTEFRLAVARAIEILDEKGMMKP